MASKRQTPVDDPEILDEWKKLHKEYTDTGLSNHQVHKQIGNLYGCSHETVRYWLRPDVRSYKTDLKKRTLVPYSESPIKEARRLHNRVYQDMRRYPDIYLKDVFCGRDISLSLDEITIKLRRLTGIEMRNKTLQRIVDDYEKKHDVRLLFESGTDNGPTYNFNYSVET